MSRISLIERRSRPEAALAAAVALALLLPLGLRAQESTPPASAPQAARLSSVDGQVRLTQDGQTLADPAVVNAPLFAGMQLTAGDDGRAEIQFVDGSVVRLSPNSALTLASLPAAGGSDGEIVLDGGLGYFELQGASQASASQAGAGQSGAGQAGTMRVRFGDAVVTASGFTVLRINLDNPPGELAVFSGNAHLERGSAVMLDLHGGESVTLNGVDPSRYNLAESIEPDSWDAWNADRDQAMNALNASRTKVSGAFADSANPAWGDLDANGSWYDVPETGYVWSPSEAASPGWEPFASGYWMWTPRFGYIWVSGNSWGYLPYQCGMWNFYDGFGWGWAPGMGACSPRWGSEGYGVNVGVVPVGYRPLRRPLLDEQHPWGPRPRRGGPAPQEHGLLPVHRAPLNGITDSPVRERNLPVTIAGHTVQAVRPLSPRQQYDHTGSGVGVHSRSEYGGDQARPGGAPAQRSGANTTFVYGGGARPPSAQNPPPAGARPNAAPSSRPPAGGSGSSASHSGGSAGASHSNSGSGGSAGHSSGGGSSSGGSHSGGGSSGGGGSHR
jgi:hypothetical protein